MFSENYAVLSHRAAAHGKLGEHQKSIGDCKKALELDPKYGKAYGRMGYVTTVSGFCHFFPLHIALRVSRRLIWLWTKAFLSQLSETLPSVL